MTISSSGDDIHPRSRRSSAISRPTLVDVLHARAADTPDRVAYSYLAAGEANPEEHLTYRELLDIAASLAGALQARDAGARGGRVLLPSSLGSHFIGGFFGCLLAGRIPVPVSMPRGAAALGELAAVARDCGATAILAPRRAIDALWPARAEHEPLAHLAWVASDETSARPAGDLASPGADDIALLQYTSGSLASPRGVMVRHSNLMHNLGVIQRAFGFSPDTRGVIWLPPHHDMGLIGGILAPLYAGFHVALMSPATFLRTPLAWLRAISKYGASVSGGPNFCYDYCVRKISAEDAEELELSTWEVAFAGAEPVHPEVLARFARHFERSGFRPDSFLPCYGLAESTLFVSGAPRRSGVKSTPGSGGHRAIASCGVVQGGRAVIVDPETRRPCEPGAAGEIWLRGPSVADGYWNKDEESAEVFRARLSGEPSGATYLRTGDLGFERDGELYVTGRLKELLIVRGRNIHPQDVEWTIESHHPWLRIGGCTVVAHPADEQRLMVLQEVERAKLPPGRSLDDLEASIRQVVARDHALDVHEVVFLRPGGIPKTTSGKIQRWKALANWQKTQAAGGEEPETRLARWVAQRFSLEAGEVLAGRPLTSLGLDSLKAAELNAYLEEQFGYTVPVERLFEGLTLSELGAEIVLHGRKRGQVRSETVASAQEPPPQKQMARTGTAPSAADSLEFSLFFFSSDAERDGTDKYRAFLECAAFAERNGFRAVWIPERHFHRFGGLFPNPAVVGAALAATTKRIRIRAGSVVLPLHDPVRTAEEWSVVDNLSGGRVDIAFATGWNADDFVLAPDKYSSRVKVMLEGVERVRGLWRGAPISLPNGQGVNTEVRIFPAPIQAELPVWITCTGAIERFEQAGAMGANVLTALLFQDIDELGKKLDAYRKSREAYGHDPRSGHVTLMLHTFLGPDEASVRSAVEAPFKAYLRDSVDLWRRGSVALDRLSDGEQRTVLDYAFQRYFHTSALFGTPRRASELAARLAGIGVGEIACLIDFGVEQKRVLEGLEHLRELKDGWKQPSPPADLGAAVRSRRALLHRNDEGVLQKARNFDLARRLQDANLLPYYPDLSKNDGATCWHEGRQLIMLGSNNYLGLTADRRVREAAARAALDDGPSVTGSRLMNGTTPAHRELELKLAAFVGREDALLLTTGYQANIGLLSAFMNHGTVLVADEECHASIYDGAAVGGCRVIQFRHNDAADLDRRLTQELQSMPALVMIDGVYSMSGDMAPLAELKAVCERHGVPLALDDAHGLGMVGRTGRGLEEEADMMGAADVLTGTFSKSFASIGGWLAGPRDLMDWVRYYGRSMLFSASMSPPQVAAAAASLDILAAEPHLVAKVRGLASYWRHGLRERGFDTGKSQTAIVPVIVGDELECLRFARRLLEEGVYANCVMAPAVPANRAMMRTTVTAAHEKHHLDRALDVFAAVGRELGIVRS